MDLQETTRVGNWPDPGETLRKPGRGRVEGVVRSRKKRKMRSRRSRTRGVLAPTDAGGARAWGKGGGVVETSGPVGGGGVGRRPHRGGPGRPRRPPGPLVDVPEWTRRGGRSASRCRPPPLPETRHRRSHPKGPIETPLHPLGSCSAVSTPADSRLRRRCANALGRPSLGPRDEGRPDASVT